jgi:hypothetical protein
MNKHLIITLCTLAIASFLITSCSISPHPNEKIIIGTWRPVKVEKVVDSSALQAASARQEASGQAADTTRKTSRGGGQSGDNAAARKEAALDRLIQSEMRATMEIFPNKTAVKNYPGKPLHATWKMKGKGTRIIGKGVENKVKFVIVIEEISKEQIVILEQAPLGDLRITYERQM